jgi:hypothetical protein
MRATTSTTRTGRSERRPLVSVTVADEAAVRDLVPVVEAVPELEGDTAPAGSWRRRCRRARVGGDWGGRHGAIGGGGHGRRGGAEGEQKPVE